MATINELQLAKELIKFPTVTPIDAGIMKFLEKKLKTLGFKTKILEFKEKNSKPVKNLYARLGNKGPNFCYAGHLDVVPAGNLKDWTVNPFKPSIKKGFLIGRGANDMKSSVAAFVSAVSNFISKERQFNGSISLLITGDEEGVAINGTKKVVKYLRKKKEKIDFCLVGEPTNPNKLGEMIKIGRRGSMTGKLTIIGIQGHVAYPDRANNPSTALIQILKELKEIKFDNGTKDFQPTNLEITKINIDNFADNVIPGSANAKFNIRFNNKHSSNSIKKKIDKIIKRICKKNKSKFNIDYSVSGEAFLTKPNDTTYMIRDEIKKITKIKPKLSTTGGTSDARFIRKIAPCLEFGLVGKTMHKVDEAVSLSDLKKLTLIYSNILKNYFK
ncbi:succinyl-diaminopimelate desuccinylase [Candidatus Pelagibacter sp. HTCC7211]|uniref:succinyl-diaminopimelate desuccinylase n=1 Tax=Pelagibacter sp. (strain HTCC7211) TaxID=439493 RepID=UPI000183B714|nr:succinyl-diaminopimelate desuccinylase [Candidatus Pelagibacter sp. HTCC7211]EDZ60429.1 succinyl-diaminopimelate desuccinylase [Candidatus Pelagibacter sp. HTCC7211]MBD1151186.1 succinyl-diaminopimelate desuccinylase [Pelagibacterales bacterium SAG-MED25]